mmetsp:Transcript_2264/g.2813  ORF Transcript_2264/g.2813 Transcript_2264/m.2813 type:complete len:137 (+) Transcript_2264:76-486(+)
MNKAFRGSMVHAPTLGTLEIIRDGLMIVNSSGSITELIDLDKDENAASKIADMKSITQVLKTSEILMPGFIDCHAHAPQYSFLGNNYCDAVCCSFLFGFLCFFPFFFFCLFFLNLKFYMNPIKRYWNEPSLIGMVK